MGLEAGVAALVDAVCGGGGEGEVAGLAHHRQVRQAEVVDVRPGGRVALGAHDHLLLVLHSQVLPEALCFLEGDEALEAEVLLVMVGAVAVERALVAEGPEADLAGVVAGPHVHLELQERRELGGEADLGY